MIISVTMNPALDKTVYLDSLEVGGLNRISAIELDAGGKGINVSKTINELGGVSVATGFIAGSIGEYIRKDLENAGIITNFVNVEGETRTNTKIITKEGILTELNEPGFEVTSNEVERLFDILISYANSEAIFILTGSVPKGVETDVYAKLIDALKGRGSKVLLDAQGELFEKGCERGPTIIKPNDYELSLFLGREIDKNDFLKVDLMEEVEKCFFGLGIDEIIISLGKEGAVFLLPGRRVICRGINVEVLSTVGAGDAMVAAIALGMERQLSQEEVMRLAMATATGAVMTNGTKPPAKNVVEKLLKEVTFIE